MKKRVFGRRLSRERATRTALFRSLTRALVKHGKIETTSAKAKAISPFVARVFALAKKDTVAAKRKVFSLLGNDKETAKNVFSLVKSAKKTGAITRMVRLGTRKGDRAPMVKMELLVEKAKSPEKPKKGGKTTKKKAAKGRTKKKEDKK